MFGDRLKQLRSEKELTQKELGRIINVSDRVIGHYEANRNFPDQDILIKIADYFDVSLDYLLERVKEKDSIEIKDVVEGRDIRLEVDKNVYPDGMTHEQVVEVLGQLKKMGMDFTKINKED